MARSLPATTNPPATAIVAGPAGHARVTVSQLINQFTAWLEKPGNYPRLARQFVLYCLENKLPLDGGSLRIYAGGKAGNQVSPVKKFILFYQTQGCPTVVADPPKHRRVPPAANELILGYLADATHLRGDKSKENYTQALNAFFTYIFEEQEAGRHATYCAQTIGQYVNDLKQRGLSAFTVNFYLSTIKQLTEWVIKHRTRLGLSDEQADGLRDVALIRGLTIERGFYKDSLDEAERDALLVSINDLTDKAIVALLVIEGLRTVEVTRLTLGDVEFSKGLLQVRGKGKSTKKAIKLFDSCSAILRQYIQSGEGIPLTASASAALFPDLETAQIRYRVDKYFKALDLKRKGMSAHSLRHTAGQLLIDKGVEPVWVQRHLRHELFETTQFYIKKKTERDYFEKMPGSV
ncbi:tyrosine-type recombinase/integrase [Fibrella sp. HMF5335]|uniref:Tyrosine-type recombinase/integrase n=1 Tax=Fibrella rubiginis TaxID=2817060 RepID=A0A939GJ22_9BACT|nr:tyrosine-type recombinase/integrase [Fibrella rubiginis]MBO0939226.1 tyrosine-type recombinase/integrase [Fibrella rubiginis]